MIPYLLSLCALMPSEVSMSKKQAANLCKYESAIRREAERNDIEPELLASVMYVESGFYPHVVSSAGACGLTQVVPKWTGSRVTGYKKYTCQQLKNPYIAIRVGAEILAFSIQVYADGNVDKGLCFYNAGSVCLRKKNFYKKLYYVKKVRRIYDAITDGC